MDNPTTIALSRLMAQTRALDVIADNIANAATPGYRTERMQFADWLVREPSGAEPAGGSPLIYAQDRATWRDQAAGAINHTGDPLDLALGNSDAWFTVATANGPRLTRAGHFKLSPIGQIVDADGNTLLDTGGQPLALAPTDTNIVVASDGTLATDNGQVGKIGIVTPQTLSGMQAEGSRLFALPDGDTTRPATAPQLVQGAIEGSNVQPVLQLTDMTDTLRQFQFLSQFVQGEGDREQSAIDKILPGRS